MKTDKSRKEFEAVIKKVAPYLIGEWLEDSQMYQDFETHAAWVVWQEAISTQRINEIKTLAVNDFFNNYLHDVSSILDTPIVVDGELKDADGDYLHKELVSRRDSYVAQLRKGE